MAGRLLNTKVAAGAIADRAGFGQFRLAQIERRRPLGQVGEHGDFGNRGGTALQCGQRCAEAVE